MSNIVEAKGLTKAYEPSLRVVDGVSFSVAEGEVFSLLGPNGAGKTTTIRMLTTLAAITEGMAVIAGHDVKKDPKAVRESIGVVPQEVTLDNELKGIENLLLAAKLQHVPDSIGKSRASELLRLVELDGFADKRVRTYSGGMKRRLQLVAALVHQPKILFLDEPTVGLDIQTRGKIWDYINQLNEVQGVTIFMTTHYLEESDRLSDVVAIMDHGKIKVSGTPRELKESLRGDVLTLTVENGGEDLTRFLSSIPGVLEVTRTQDSYRLKLPRVESALPQIITDVSSRGLKIIETSFSKPTLDQVFLEVTGRSLRDAEEGIGHADRFADAHSRETR
jgi:ABC-2 type transport system ATP-binding protein